MEAGLLLLVETFAGGLAFEGVLLLDQGADAVEDLLVVHGLLRGGPGWLPVMMPGARATASADGGAGPDGQGSGCEPGPSSWPPWSASMLLPGRRGRPGDANNVGQPAQGSAVRAPGMLRFMRNRLSGS